MGSKYDLEVFLCHSHCAKPELQLDIFVVDVNQVFNCLEDNFKSTLDNINAHLATGSDGNRVSVYHLEALLEDGFLTSCWGDLFLVVVTVEMLLEDWVNYEARSNTNKSEFLVSTQR